MPSRPPCPWCGSVEVVPIVYGEPGPDDLAAVARGEIQLGGCVLHEGRPTEACRWCGARFDRLAGDLGVNDVLRPWRRAIDDAFEVFGTGDLPVVVHVPHAGLHVPEDVRAGIVLDDRELADELRLITDHRTDVLASGAIEAGARAFVNRVSRLVVDPERFPDPVDEVMTAVGMSAVYTRTTDQRTLRHPTAAERARLVERFFDPHAEAIADLVDATLERHGRCVIVDLHSYPVRRLAYEIGGDERPEVCVGVDRASTPATLAEAVEAVAADHVLGTARDTPFAGTYVPLRHLDDPRVTSVMLEIRRDTHLAEATADAWPPHGWVRPTDGEARVQAFVAAVVARVAELVQAARRPTGPATGSTAAPTPAPPGGRPPPAPLPRCPPGSRRPAPG